MGSKEQDWEGTVLSKLGKGSEIVLFQKGFFIDPKGLGLVMSNIYHQSYPSERHFFFFFVGGGAGISES